MVEKILKTLPLLNKKYPRLTRGGCGVFAKAISKITGYNEFGLLWDNDDPQGDPPAHVYVKIGDKFLDANGLHTKKEILDSYKNTNEDGYSFGVYDYNEFDYWYEKLGEGLFTMDYKPQYKEIKNFIINNIRNVKTFEHFLLSESTFNDIYKKKNRWIQLIDDNKIDELKDNLYILINNAYSRIGGNNVIKSPDDIFKRNYWEAIDIDDDPDADSIIFGRKTDFGIKITGIGHDGKRSSKKVLINKLKNQLNKKGYYMEASGKLLDTLNMNVNYIKDYKIINKILGDNIIYIDDGYYKKYLENKKITDPNRLFGKPNI